MAGRASKTVLPHEAFAKCDIRLVEAQTPAEIFEKVGRACAQACPGGRVHAAERHAAVEDADGFAVAEPLRQAVVDAQGVEPLLYPSAGGSLPDYVFTKILGMPTPSCVPYANADEANHAPNENLKLDAFSTASGRARPS